MEIRVRILDCRADPILDSLQSGGNNLTSDPLGRVWHKKYYEQEADGQEPE
jgi:hypothetical protein